MLMRRIEKDCVASTLVGNDNRQYPSRSKNTTPFKQRLDDVDVVLQIVPRNDIIQFLVAEHAQIIPGCMNIGNARLPSNHPILPTLAGRNNIDPNALPRHFAVPTPNVNSMPFAERKQGQHLRVVRLVDGRSTQRPERNDASLGLIKRSTCRDISGRLCATPQ